MIGPEAIGPGSHRFVVDQASGINVSQTFQRQPPALIGIACAPNIGFAGEPMLPLRLGLEAVIRVG